MTNEQGLVERLRNLNPWRDMGWPETCRASAGALASQSAQIAELQAENLRIQNEWDNADEMLQACRTQIADLKRALDTARRDAMEEAAKVCSKRSAELWELYKRGHGPERADPHYQGMSDGADDCERLIRALQTKDQSHGA